MNAFQRAAEAPWAMLSEDVERLLSIAEREHNPTPEALEAYRATAARFGERVKVRENVALLYAQGPMFKGANLMTEISGATSYDILRRDLQAGLDSTSIDAIMICMDTPGGESHGCDELAAAIYDARSIKPIETYVSGYATSAGYWLAAATSRITISPLGTVGSIGAVLAVADRRKAEERSGVQRIEFVSSQSPGKRPDPATDDGRARLQKFVDDIGDVFVGAVAKYRGVKAEHVIEKYGRGGIEVGANAVNLGMADGVGQFEAALAALSTRGRNHRFLKSRSPSMSTSDNPQDFARVSAEARNQERARLGKITGHAAFATHGKLGAVLSSADVSAETAVAILDAAALDTTASVTVAVAEAKKQVEDDPAKKFDKDNKPGSISGLGAADATDKPASGDFGWGKAKSYVKVGK